MPECAGMITLFINIAEFMEIISKNTFQHITQQNDALLLKTTYDRPKLLEKPNGEIIKVFYPKNKRFSSNHRKPYALRFCQNAEHLRNKNINAPLIQSIQYCAELDAYIIIYPKIPGENARVLSNMAARPIIPSTAQYIAELHDKGIFFRSIHLENLLYDEKQGFSLLDIVDVTFKKNPLNIFLRYRNLKHMFRISDDVAFWNHYGTSTFLKDYFAATNLSFFSKKLLSLLLMSAKALSKSAIKS
jgi:hypothetical protein